MPSPQREARFAADPHTYFAGYTEDMPARHAAPKRTWLTRLKAWWKRRGS
mgnify:CR=1 FL=1